MGVCKRVYSQYWRMHSERKFRKFIYSVCGAIKQEDVYVLHSQSFRTKCASMSNLNVVKVYMTERDLWKDLLVQGPEAQGLGALYIVKAVFVIQLVMSDSFYMLSDPVVCKLITYLAVEHSNSGKKFRFDSILATESIFSIRFGNLINLPLVH